MKAPVLLTPPVRTPASYRVLPEGCTGCVWRWRTSSLPWCWVRVVPNLDCPAAHPDDEASGKGALPAGTVADGHRQDNRRLR